MANVIDAVTAILSRSERQVEVAGQNVSNVATPGYKRILSFERAMDVASSIRSGRGHDDVVSDFTPGKLIDTGRALDLAIAGPGFFVVGDAKSPVYTRCGQFDRDADGRLVTRDGLALQVEGGADLRLKSGEVKVLSDGSVLEGGAPIGKLAIMAIDPAAARAVEGGYTAQASSVSPIERPSVYQGKLEGSNVSMGAEMVTIMGALRRAETGQRLANVYDDLMGRVLQSFGQSA